ncbi:MAG: hypothetical protein EZS28_038877, partial [Streblomastix strix]
MGTYAKAQSPTVFDQLITLKNGRTYRMDHTSQDYQTSVMEWLDSLTYPPNIPINTRGSNRKNDSGTQLQATVNGEANPEFNITKTSANTPPHNENGSDGLGGNGCGTQLQAATNENGHETIRQSITLAMKTITNKQMTIKSEDSNNQTVKNLTMKPNINRIVQTIDQERQDHLTQLIPNKKQETQTLHNLKSNLLQSLNPQNQAKQKERLQYLNRRLNKLMNTILERKTGQSKLIPDKSLGSLEARTNSDTLNHNNHKWRRIQKSMKTKRKGVQNQKTPFHSHNTI